MGWWPRRRRAEQEKAASEAAEHRNAAQARLDAAKEQNGEIRAVSRALRRMRQDNHFADVIRAALGDHR